MGHHGHKHKKKLAEETKHSSGVSSVGLIQKGEIEIAKLEGFIRNLLATKVKDLYRLKGIFSIKDNPKRFVIHGVHETLNFEFLQPWKPDEERVSRMVFIGKNLDKAELEKGFLNCFASTSKKR